MRTRAMVEFVVLCSFSLIFRVSSVAAQTSPEDFLGFEVGADRRLADYERIQAYFEKLSEESERVELTNIGTSTLGKPIIMAVISNESNLAKLDDYRQLVRRLRDPRTLSPNDAEKLSREGKVILAITCNVHATEIASSQAAMELAYRLATGSTPFDARKVLDQVIILLVPTINPDGQQMVTDWYNKYLGTEYEGARMPYLYHHYAGHDNARDSFMLNLAETRAYAKVMFHDWLPQIHQDQHQMGSTGARLFLPPYIDPPYPTIHPLMIHTLALAGSNMAYDLTKQGFSGVVQSRIFPAWLFGNLSDTCWLHGVASLLSEMASVNVATPIYIEPNEIPASFSEKRMDFPRPWPGGWWRLRDIVDYELALSLSLINSCYLHKDDFLLSFYQMYKDAVEKRDDNEPYAFVIPRRQHDYGTTLKMVETLMRGGVEIHQANGDFVADHTMYGKGSFVVKMAQPYGSYAQALLERQRYPDIRQYPGGPPVRPYDSAGMTLPLQMGVRCDPVNESFEADLVLMESFPSSPGDVLPDTPFLVLDSRENLSFAAVIALTRSGAKVFRSRHEIKREGLDVAAGSFLIESSSSVRQSLESFMDKRYLKVGGLRDAEAVEKDAVNHPRIGLYQSWMANMPEGWVRYFLDDFEIPFTTVHNDHFKAEGGRPARLRVDFDVIVFPDEDPTVIKTGMPGRTSRTFGSFTTPPPEYRGGLGDEGIQALKMFVEEGGTLVTLNNACKLALDELGVPARNAIERVEESEFFCPSSLLKLEVDHRSPIGYGMPAEAPAVFSQSLAMDTWIPSGDWERHVVARFPDKDLLMSGWLLGEDLIARKAAVVDVKYKKGRVILIGIRSQNRAQSHGTYKFLLNAFLYPAG